MKAINDSLSKSVTTHFSNLIKQTIIFICYFVRKCQKNNELKFICFDSTNSLQIPNKLTLLSSVTKKSSSSLAFLPGKRLKQLKSAKTSKVMLNFVSNQKSPPPFRAIPPEDMNVHCFTTDSPSLWLIRSVQRARVC